jgi:predicted ATPase
MIHAKTEGSPLFMADLTRWIVARGLEHATGDLPESVRGMIARKIDQVPDADRRLLLAASVQGAEFDSAVIAEALQLDQAAVEEQLEQLERVYVFVARAGEQAFPDGALTARFRFVHVLYQNALYASLQPARRVALAKAIVAPLAAHYGRDAARRRAARGAMRDRARFRAGRRVLLSRRRARDRAVRIP